MRADIFNPSGHPQADALYRASVVLIFVALAVLLLWLFWPEVETAWASFRRAVHVRLAARRARRKLVKAGAK